MGCSSCGTETNEDGTPKGCGSKGSCNTGACNMRSTYDWLADLGIDDPYAENILEVSFKNGASKDFFYASPDVDAYTGDMVAVETNNGYNVGQVTLSGELVRLQMKKKKVKEAKVTHSILRKANERDLEKLAEVRAREQEALIRARLIARRNQMKMKISDIEYQGDGKKMTIYYTSDDRVDFREIVREYSHDFRVKVEMRHIHARQETARLGGIGSCGRELCCSTWLSDFPIVNTAAARYQNIAINQDKITGQCGRLKCCLNYELNTYMEALESFPKKADKIRTGAGQAILIKTDIFKGIMYYTYRENRGMLYPIPVEKVHEMLALKAKGKEPADLQSYQQVVEVKDDVFEYEDVTGAIELPDEKRRKKRRNKKGGKSGSGKSSGSKGGRRRAGAKPGEAAAATADAPSKSKSRSSRSKRRRKPRGGGQGSGGTASGSATKPNSSGSGKGKSSGGETQSGSGRKQRRGRRGPKGKSNQE